MPPVSDGDPRRSRRSFTEAMVESAAQRLRDQQELSDRRAAEARTPVPQSPTNPWRIVYSYTGSNTPATPGSSAHQVGHAVDEEMQVPSWWDRLVNNQYTRPAYVPINTLHEKIAIACANDSDAPERWAGRSENDREHYRGIADRALRLIPVPGAREEQP